MLKHIILLLYQVCINVCFRHFGIFFLFRPRVSSRALGSVARREPARTPRASLGPGRGPRARALGVQSGKFLRGGIPST